MAELRVVHYLNQFFAGIGGEEEANRPIEVREDALGPGRALQSALKGNATIAATIVGGDNYVAEHPTEAADAIRAALDRLRPDVLVAGPAFEAGRYGLACGLVCQTAEQAGIPAVTAMHPENPGVMTYRQHVVIVPAGPNAASMGPAVEALARLATKLGRREPLGPADQEGYIARGQRRLGERAQPGHERAMAMLRAKLRGEPFATELPIELPERVAPAPAVRDLAHARIALVTTGGLVRKGNPEGQVPGNATRFHRHEVAELEALSGDDWQAYHSGYFNHIVNSNPNYILPLSFMREFEREGIVGGIHPHIYAMPGVGTPVARCRGFGEDIGRELKEAGVDGALLVAT